MRRLPMVGRLTTLLAVMRSGFDPPWLHQLPILEFVWGHFRGRFEPRYEV
jgi:hypothetical protein